MKQLAEVCQDVANKLLVVLESLKAQVAPDIRRRWESLGKAAAALNPRTKAIIKKLETRLENLLVLTLPMAS